MKNRNKILLIFFLSAFSFTVKAQPNFSIGGYIGGGFISGNSPNVGSYNTSVFIQFKTPFSEIIFTRVSFLYGQDIDKLFGARKDYFPFLRGISLKGILSQNVSDIYYVEEGAGLLYLNDRVFNDSSVDDYGALFSLTGGIDFLKDKSNGFRLGVGTEYGLTFNKTLANYLSVYLIGQYFF